MCNGFFSPKSPAMQLGFFKGIEGALRNIEEQKVKEESKPIFFIRWFQSKLIIFYIICMLTLFISSILIVVFGELYVIGNLRTIDHFPQNDPLTEKFTVELKISSTIEAYRGYMDAYFQTPYRYLKW